MKFIELINKYKDSKTINPDFEEEGLRFIITEYYNISKSDLLLKYNEEIKDNDLHILINLIETYIYQNKPVQYIMHTAYFYNEKYYVNENVLIPRFDSEILVEEALKLINEKNNCKVLDIGTGSGCLAISIKKHSNAILYAIDISKEALDVAKKNAIALNADIIFIQNDLLNGINDKFDYIISNPPYIAKGEYIMKQVHDNEPHLALYSSDNGMYHYKQIISKSYDLLNDDGALLLEIPDNKCDLIIDYSKVYYKCIKVIKDYNNQRRVLIMEKKK